MSSFLDERYRDEHRRNSDGMGVNEAPIASQSIGVQDLHTSSSTPRYAAHPEHQLMDVDIENNFSDGGDVLPLPPPVHTLSAAAWIFGFFLLAFFLVWVAIASIASAVVLWFTLLPLAGCFAAWWRQKHILPLDDVARSVIKGVSPSAAVIFLVELLLTLLCFAGFLRAGIISASDTGGWAFSRKSAAGIFFFCVLVGLISTLEEIAKYRLCVDGPPRNRRLPLHPTVPMRRERLVLLLSTITGFACGWTLFASFFFSAAQTRFNDIGAGGIALRTFTLALVLTLASLPAHLLSGYAMSLDLALATEGGEHLSRSSILFIPCLARFTITLILALNAFAFFVPLASPLWWIVSVLPCWAVSAVLYKHARDCEARMPHEYLRRVGTLLVSYHVFPNQEPVSPRAIIARRRELPPDALHAALEGRRSSGGYAELGSRSVSPLPQLEPTAVPGRAATASPLEAGATFSTARSDRRGGYSEAAGILDSSRVPASGISVASGVTPASDEALKVPLPPSVGFGGRGGRRGRYVEERTSVDEEEGKHHERKEDVAGEVPSSTLTKKEEKDKFSRNLREFLD